MVSTKLLRIRCTLHRIRHKYVEFDIFYIEFDVKYIEFDVISSNSMYFTVNLTYFMSNSMKWLPLPQLNCRHYTENFVIFGPKNGPAYNEFFGVNSVSWFFDEFVHAFRSNFTEFFDVNSTNEFSVVGFPIFDEMDFQWNLYLTIELFPRYHNSRETGLITTALWYQH